MKAEGAKRNTHILTVQGMAVKDDRLYPMPLNVRFTAEVKVSYCWNCGARMEDEQNG